EVVGDAFGGAHLVLGRVAWLAGMLLGIQTLGVPSLGSIHLTLLRSLERGPARAGDGLNRQRARSVRHEPELFRERGHDLRVELRTGAALELRERLVRDEPATVGALRGHRVEGVRDEEDPRAERDLLARQPIRIAPAVPA